MYIHRYKDRNQLVWSEMHCNTLFVGTELIMAYMQYGKIIFQKD